MEKKRKKGSKGSEEDKGDRLRFLKNLEVNLGSLSDTILDGSPYNLTISLIYREVNFSKENLILIGMKSADLVSLSTITQIESKPLGVLGSPTTKSMEILSHFH